MRTSLPTKFFQIFSNFFNAFFLCLGIGKSNSDRTVNVSLDQKYELFSLKWFIVTFFWIKTRFSYYTNNWIYTTNHKRIAVNYFWFVILSGIVGMVLATVIRLEFAYPGVGVFAGDSIQYLSLASAHGVIMVFFMIMPLLFGAFANFLLPTQLGVHDVAFPRLNSAAFWFLPGGLLMLCQLVCVDRRYQRMNCFNIREVESLLKRKFFTDLINSKDHRQFLNNTAIGTRFKTNDLSSINSNMINFYNYGLEFTPKNRNVSYTLSNLINSNSTISFNLNSSFFKSIDYLLTFNFFYYLNILFFSLFYNHWLFANFNIFFRGTFKLLLGIFSIFSIFVVNLFNLLFNEFSFIINFFSLIEALLIYFFQIIFFLFSFLFLGTFKQIYSDLSSLYWKYQIEFDFWINCDFSYINTDSDKPKSFLYWVILQIQFVADAFIDAIYSTLYDYLLFLDITIILKLQSFSKKIKLFFYKIFKRITNFFIFIGELVEKFFSAIFSEFTFDNKTNLWKIDPSFSQNNFFRNTFTLIKIVVNQWLSYFDINNAFIRFYNISEKPFFIFTKGASKNPIKPEIESFKNLNNVLTFNSVTTQYYVLIYAVLSAPLTFVASLVYLLRYHFFVINSDEIIDILVDWFLEIYGRNNESRSITDTTYFKLVISPFSTIYSKMTYKNFSFFYNEILSNVVNKYHYLISFFSNLTIPSLSTIFSNDTYFALLGFFSKLSNLIIFSMRIFLLDAKTFLIFENLYDFLPENIFYSFKTSKSGSMFNRFNSNYFSYLENFSFFKNSNVELSETSRHLKNSNPVFKYDFKSGDYFPKLYKEAYNHMFSSILNLTTGLRTSPWYFSGGLNELLENNVHFFLNNNSKKFTFKTFEISNRTLNKFFFTDGFYNFFNATSVNNELNLRWIATPALNVKFEKMFFTSSMQQRIYSNWQQLKFTREAWRCKLLTARHQKTLFRRYMNEDGVFWSIERNAKDLIPGWAMITPFSSRTRFTAIGKTDIGLMGVLLVLNSSIISGANFLVTYRYLSTLNNRKMRDARAFFTEAIMVASWMMILANPMLVIGIIMLISDRHWQTSFFDYSGGGDTVMFQHMFWFFGHPEVYIIIIPTFGFTNTMISYYLKKRVSARASLLYSMYTIAFLGFFVWGHHMYMVGLSHTTRMLFSTLTVMISVPAATKIMHWCVTTVNSSFAMELPLLFTFTFIFFFVSGGISGMCVAHTGMDVLFHDTFYVIGHFHVMLAGGAMFASFGAFYFYFPAIFGVKYSRIYAYLHYSYYLIGQLMTVIPMFWLGYAGMPRRVLDYPASFGGWHSVISAGHMLNVAGLMAFFIMIFDSLRQARASTRNTFGVNRYNTRLNFYLYEIARLIFIQQKSLFLFRMLKPSSVKLNNLNYLNYEPLETTLFSYIFFKK